MATTQLPTASIQAYLDQAKKLLTAEYKQRRTAEYNIWFNSSKNAWMQPHVVVPYPPFIVNSAIAPFTPSVAPPTENEIVATALSLYNNDNPNAVPVATAPDAVSTDSVALEEPVEQIQTELADSATTGEQPTVAEPQATTEEPANAPAAEEEAHIVEPTPYVDEIYKIYAVPDNIPSVEPLLSTIEKDLGTVPQPAEALAKVSTSGRILPSVLERLQAITSKWTDGGTK